jgi:hypothetical protein
VIRGMAVKANAHSTNLQIADQAEAVVAHQAFGTLSVPPA